MTTLNWANIKVYFSQPSRVIIFATCVAVIIASALVGAALDIIVFDAAMLNSAWVENNVFPNLDLPSKTAYTQFLSIMSSLYLGIELYIVGFLMLGLHYLIYLNTRKRQKPLTMNSTPTFFEFFKQTILFYLGLSIAAVACGGQSVGQLALMCTDTGLLCLSFRDNDVLAITVVVSMLTFLSMGYIVWSQQNKSQDYPYIHVYIVIGLILTDVLMFALMTGPVLLGCIIIFAINTVTTALVILCHPYIHRLLGKLIVRKNLCVKQYGAKLHNVRLFQFVVVSKWNAWWLSNLGQMAILLGVEASLPFEWKAAIFALGSLLWLYTARNLLCSAYVVSAMRTKPEILVPAEPIYMFHIVLRPWLLTMQITFLKFYQLHTSRLAAAPSFFGRANLWLQSALKTIACPAFGLDRSWLLQMVAERVLIPGELDSVTWSLFTKVGILCHLGSSAVNVALITSVGAITVGGLSYAENVHVIPGQAKTSLHFLQNVPGVTQARIENPALEQSFRSLQEASYSLNTNARTRINNIWPNFLFPQPEVKQAQVAIFNIVRHCREMGITIPEPEQALRHNYTSEALSATSGVLPKPGAIYDVAKNSK